MLVEGLFDGSPSIGFVSHRKNKIKMQGTLTVTDLLSFNITCCTEVTTEFIYTAEERVRGLRFLT